MCQDSQPARVNILVTRRPPQDAVAVATGNLPARYAGARSSPGRVRSQSGAYVLLISPHFKRERFLGGFKQDDTLADESPSLLFIEPCCTIVADCTAEPRCADPCSSQARFAIR